MERKHRIAAAVAICATIACGMVLVAFGPRPAKGGITPKYLCEASADAQPDEQTDPVLRRCRTITVPESSCDAAWAARRQHFFGGKARP